MAILEKAGLDAARPGVPNQSDFTHFNAQGRARMVNVGDKAPSHRTAQFDHWTREPFSANFRKMLTLEQYRDARLAQLYQENLASGPVKYMAAIFRPLTDSDETAMQLALDFYGPMYLLYSVYDGAADQSAVAPMLEAHIDRFIAKLEGEYRKKDE